MALSVNFAGFPVGSRDFEVPEKGEIQGVVVDVEAAASPASASAIAMDHWETLSQIQLM